MTIYDSTAPYPRDLIGYGRDVPHARWPGGARIAVQFVLNYEEGGENSVLHGDAGSEQFLSEMFNPASYPGRHMSMESIYEYGSRAGVWRILREFEKRGLLHCRIELPEGPAAHCVCVHLSLFGYSRRRQMMALADYLDRMADITAPLIIAGDFNDWNNRASHHLAQQLGLTEVFSGRNGAPCRSFPAALPMFRLDRIYVRGFKVHHTEVHHGYPWSAISDHAALSAHLARHGR